MTGSHQKNVETQDITNWGTSIKFSLLLSMIKKELTRSLSICNKQTKTFYQDYLYCFEIFCATVLNIFQRKIISNSTNFEVHKTVESTGEMKLMKIYIPVFVQFLLTLKFIFLRSPGNCFLCRFRQLFKSYAEIA